MTTVMPRLSLSCSDQRVDAARGDRVEIGGRLVEKENPRVERERPRERGALDHAAGKLRTET